MVTHGSRWATTIESWSPRLFYLAGAFLLISATTIGVTYLAGGSTAGSWVGLTLELGRLAALLGTAGLTVALARRRARFGTLCTVVATVAAGFTSVLIGLATLDAAGVAVSVLPAVGLSTWLLSVGTFGLVGIGILRTAAYPRLLGWLLLLNVGALLILFFGRLVLPLGLIATVVPGLQVLLYGGIGYRLTLGLSVSPQTDPTPESTL